MGRLNCRALATCVLVIATCSFGLAQWTAYILHPKGATRSYAIGVDGSEFVGFMWPPIEGRALYWPAIGADPIDLTPVGAIGAQAWDVEDGVQVGGAYFPAGGVAAVWSGSAESFFSINPAGATDSAANRLVDGVVVGAAVVNGVSGAALWTQLEPSAWVNLHPNGYTSSYAAHTDGKYQVGFTNANSTFRAGVWQNTKQSFVDIHPIGRNASRAFAVENGVVGGYVTLNNSRDAALWTAPTFNYRTIHPYNTQPFGYSTSEIWDMGDQMQVGYYAEFGVTQASIWEGTSGSWYSLEAYLPPGARYSRARRIGIDNDYVYVSGETDIQGSGPQAFVLVARRTSTLMPTSMSVGPGFIQSGSLQSLEQSDDQILRVLPGPVLSTSVAPVQVTVEAASPSSEPESIWFSLESRASVVGLRIDVSFYNFQSGSYELINSGTSFGGDRTMNAYVDSNAARFVHPSTQRIRAKVSYRVTGPVLAFPWVVSLDRTVFKLPLVK